MKFGLIGYPLSHSFSKQYFSEKFGRERFPFSYENFEIQENEIPKFIAHNHLNGFNVTIPYKEKILAFLDDISEDAGKIGAVNCVKVISQHNSKILKGFNTDWKGFYLSLKKMLTSSQNSAIILGTGGAAKAVAYALEQWSIPVTYVSRKSGFLQYEEITQEVIQNHNIIVNTTPLGMYPHITEAPDIPYEYLSEKHILYDLIYNPEETLFLQRGKAQGCMIKNGLEMLQIQAEESFKIWMNENLH